MSRTIREHREERGLTREDLASLAEVSVEFIERCEDIGFTQEPGTERGDTLAARFCKALGVNRDDLKLDYVPVTPRHDFEKKRYSRGSAGAMRKLLDILDGDVGKWKKGQTVKERAGEILREQGRI